MTRESSPQRKCKTCGAPVGRFAPAGVCARCFLATGLSVSPAESAPGEKVTRGRLGNYDLLEEVGHGGMGVIYRARDLTLNRVVALKLMLAGNFANAREVKRFAPKPRPRPGWSIPTSFPFTNSANWKAGLS